MRHNIPLNTGIVSRTGSGFSQTQPDIDITTQLDPDDLLMLYVYKLCF